MPLRPRKYKPCLVSREERLQIRDEFFARLQGPLDAWRAREIDDREIVAMYWVEFLKLWRPRHWHSGKLPWVTGENKTSEIKNLPLAIRLRSSPDAAQKAFAIWCENPEWISVREDIPDCMDLLEVQCDGRRVITLLTDYNGFQEEVNGRDPLSFLLHDLVHAYQFFADPEIKAAQIEFYKDLRERLKRDEELRQRLEREPQFAEQFEYLIADMNSHPAHLQAYFDHILIARPFKDEDVSETQGSAF